VSSDNDGAFDDGKLLLLAGCLNRISRLIVQHLKSPSPDRTRGAIAALPIRTRDHDT
jgi:hypothetical protein